MTSEYTQLGLAGLTLGILFFIVRYFVSAMNSKDNLNQNLTEKFIKIAEDNIKTRGEQTQMMNKQVKSTDKLSKMIARLLETKEIEVKIKD